MAYRQQAMNEHMAATKRRIVMAACLFENGEIITGLRHFCLVMHAQLDAEPRLRVMAKTGEVEQGFIDQQGQFYNRTDAWVVAEAAGQILFHKDWFIGELHSEHLY